MQKFFKSGHNLNLNQGGFEGINWNFYDKFLTN